MTISCAVRSPRVRPWPQVAFLAVAAAGLLTMFFGNIPGFPPVPPGPIMLTVAAILTMLVPRWWSPLFGVIASVVVAVSAAVANVGLQLDDLSPMAGFVGSWLLQVGLGGAFLTGVVLLVTRRRRTT